MKLNTGQIRQKKIFLSVLFLGLIMVYGNSSAVTGTSLSTGSSKTVSSQSQGQSDAEKEARRKRMLEKMKKLAGQSSQFNVKDYLSVGNEANLTISAEDDKNNLIYRITNMAITIIGIVAILLYVVAGFFIITASDENQLQKGKTIIIYTSLGIIVAFSSYILVQIILSAIFTVA